MKVLVIGALGQLGTELCKAFGSDELVTADVDGGDVQVDLRNALETHRVVEEVQPQVVFNTAAAHNVPQCEEEPDLAFAVNATGARNLARACHAAGARLVHMSTDYVFGHGGTRPYVETDLPAPLSIYAASKLAGEHLVAAECPNHQIIRTAAMYGHAPCRAKGGKNFVSLMLHLAETKGEVRVVTDEITTPTYTGALVRQMRLLAEQGEPGVYHCTCRGECSWYDFAKAIFEETGTDVKLHEAKSSDFQSGVQRPSYSVLENRHAAVQGLCIMPEWRDGLKEYLAS
ncbi:MAG: dTDP-4-dehydrorhamnose reductase [Candidatus Hydrogenedentes bacterium]|nr:dTDP-4-dehydrorhamnose reductase [Candidatus Hydrogenedentota bacterium]